MHGKRPAVADDIVQELHDCQHIVDESKGDTVVVMLSGRVFGDAAAEIERLRRWKAKATEVLKQWDTVADMVPARLGDKKSDAVAAEIERLRSGMDQLSEAVGRFVSAGLQLEEELSEKRALVDQLQVEVEESDQLIRRSADLLNGVANALHRGPLENGLWSWHDLPERAAAERALADQLADALSDHMRGDDHPAYTAWEEARRG